MTTEYNIQARELEGKLNATDNRCKWTIEKEGFEFLIRHRVRTYEGEELEDCLAQGITPPTEEEQLKMHKECFFIVVKTRQYFGKHGTLSSETAINREFLKDQHPNGVSFLINLIHTHMEEELALKGYTWADGEDKYKLPTEVV